MRFGFLPGHPHYNVLIRFIFFSFFFWSERRSSISFCATPCEARPRHDDEDIGKIAAGHGALSLYVDRI
jgi:hypothetical protein